ncbi:MAG: DinB family protein [Bacteroidetes bacterium]|nr:DinB family protein [Bacteroidota bacterium]
MKKNSEVAINILSHIDIYLDQIDDAKYGKPLPLLSDASIGGHTRHAMDGFLCIMKQHECGVISYDKRERNKQLEVDTSSAKKKINEIKDFLRSLNENCTCGFEINYENQSFTTDSTIKREIVHNIEHVIHHLAIVKIAILAYHDNVKLPPEFGVAPSTLLYWQKNLVQR